jgi:hypothetical protein
MAYKVVDWGSGTMRRFHGTIRDGFGKLKANQGQVKTLLQKLLRGDKSTWTTVVEITEEGGRQSASMAQRWWPATKELFFLKVPVLNTGLASATGGRAITCVGAWINATDHGLFNAGRVFVMAMTDAATNLDEL